MTLHGIVVELINAGAHVDTVNSEGKTPYDAATTGNFFFLFNKIKDLIIDRVPIIDKTFINILKRQYFEPGLFLLRFKLILRVYLIYINNINIF